MSEGMPDAPQTSPAEEKVNGPAIGLIVTAIVGIIAVLGSIVWQLVAVGGLAAELQGMEGMEGAPVLSPMLASGIAIASGVIGCIVGVVVLLGALKMKALESYTFSMVAAILAMIPCISPCCVLGIPFGIWALVILNDPQVKAAFRN